MLFKIFRAFLKIIVQIGGNIMFFFVMICTEYMEFIKTHGFGISCKNPQKACTFAPPKLNKSPLPASVRYIIQAAF